MVGPDNGVCGPGSDPDVTVEVRVAEVAGGQFQAEEDPRGHVLGEAGIDAHQSRVAQRRVSEGLGA